MLIALSCCLKICYSWWCLCLCLCLSVVVVVVLLSVFGWNLSLLFFILDYSVLLCQAVSIFLLTYLLWLPFCLVWDIFFVKMANAKIEANFSHNDYWLLNTPFLAVTRCTLRTGSRIWAILSDSIQFNSKIFLLNFSQFESSLKIQPIQQRSLEVTGNLTPVVILRIDFT